MYVTGYEETVDMDEKKHNMPIEMERNSLHRKQYKKNNAQHCKLHRITQIFSFVFPPYEMN